MNRRSRTSVLIWAFAAGAAACYSSGPAAQPARVKAGAGEDLRAIYANAADVAEGKRLADSNCVACHGANGVSATRAVPHLAGQRAGYLYLELKAYQAGGRPDAPMTAAVKFLSDDALVKVAAYYSALDPAQPVAASGGKPAPAKPDPVQAGKAAAATCAACHGETGVSKTPGMPSLVGLDPQYLLSAMKAYKGGQRKNDTMKSILAAVGEADMSNIAFYYALQKPAPAQTPAAGDEVAGKAVAAGCALCHGDKGVSSNPAIPSLAGQDAEYLAVSLRAYKDGSRNEETMKAAGASLDEKATKNMAAFYAKQQPQPTKVRKPLTMADWAQRCDRCHGIDGNSTDPHLPALAGQRADYLEKVLHAYRTGERKSPQMHAMSELLTEADVENLAGYYSRQKARAVVYVILPAK